MTTTHRSGSGVLYLGMRPAAEREVAAVERAAGPDGGVTAIRAWETVDVDETVAGVPEERAARLRAWLGGKDPSSRDELARLALALWRIGEGSLAANRLVLSGHGDGYGVLDDLGRAVTLTDLEELARIFPEGAARIEHVAIAACFGGTRAQVAQLRLAFPHLKSAYGYDRYAPGAAGAASARDLAAWEAMTDGDRPGRVDPNRAAVRTWNVEDGFEHMPLVPRARLEADLARNQATYDAYLARPEKPTEPPHDRQLDEYYADLVALERHPDLPAGQRAAVRAQRVELLRWRHPELFGR